MNDFEKLVEPHRTELRLHCYRMLGSSCDAEDMVQETLARAFRSQATLQDRGAARAWLYRIATNVCLNELAQRPLRARGFELGPAHDPDITPPPATPDEEWIEPCPSSWIIASDAHAQYSTKESVALAFVAALQVLTPAQRAVLLLREVVGLSAEETATTLQGSLSAVNSSLHRARAALAERVGPRESWSPDLNAPVDRDLLQNYLQAWESGDLAAVVALLHAEAAFSMPPAPIWFAGRAAIERFLTNRFCKTLRSGQFRGLPVEANAQAGFAFYRSREDGSAELFAIHLVAARQNRIVSIEHFMTKGALSTFTAEGVPATLR